MEASWKGGCCEEQVVIVTALSLSVALSLFSLSVFGLSGFFVGMSWQPPAGCTCFGKGGHCPACVAESPLARAAVEAKAERKKKRDEAARKRRGSISRKQNGLAKKCLP